MIAITLSMAALLATAAGSACLYLASPRQQWLSRPWPALAGRGGGGCLLVLGWLGWCVPLHPATAFFVVLTFAMLVLTVLPAVVAVRAASRGGAA